MDLEVFWGLAILLITIVVIWFSITRFIHFWYDLPVEKLRSIADRNGKSDPYNWVFFLWFISWPGVFLYWLLNEKNKNFRHIFNKTIDNKVITHKLFWPVVIVVVILGFCFYWFQWRPAEIRKSCGRWVGASFDRCIHQKGLEK